MNERRRMLIENSVYTCAKKAPERKLSVQPEDPFKPENIQRLATVARTFFWFVRLPEVRDSEQSLVKVVGQRVGLNRQEALKDLKMAHSILNQFINKG